MMCTSLPPTPNVIAEFNQRRAAPRLSYLLWAGVRGGWKDVEITCEQSIKQCKYLSWRYFSVYNTRLR